MPTQTYAARAIEPLLVTARRMDWPSRRAYLDDLRCDAPTLIAELERVLARESGVIAHAFNPSRPVGFLATCTQYLLTSAAYRPHHRLNQRT